MDPILSPCDAAARHARRVALLALAAAMATALAGCSAPKKMLQALVKPDEPPPPPPTRIVGSVQATTSVNPDARKRASPILVRVFELKSDAGFNSADFMSLFQRDQAELAADIVLREEFILKPGEQRALDRTAGDQTQFLAVFAAYRDLERARWRALVPVRRAVTQRLDIQIDALAVSIVTP